MFVCGVWGVYECVCCVVCRVPCFVCRVLCVVCCMLCVVCACVAYVVYVGRVYDVHVC